MPTKPDPLALYEPIFQQAAQEWNIDPLLLKAVAMQESRGDPRAVSKAGAQGLMQIMPGTAKNLGATDPFDPAQSIFAGAKYLNEALDKEGNPDLALLYYHGGPDWRGKYGRESAGYVPSVAGYYKAFQAAQQPQPSPVQSATSEPSQ
jgi:soluble lytic murein transglycosylase-like protein